jgi:hypothetical protein
MVITELCISRFIQKYIYLNYLPALPPQNFSKCFKIENQIVYPCANFMLNWPFWHKSVSILFVSIYFGTTLFGTKLPDVDFLSKIPPFTAGFGHSYK